MHIKNLSPFVGIHCETTTSGTLLNQLGIKLSEPMLFGLGEGLSFIYWKMKNMEFPFIGGRTKTLSISKALAKNLHLNLDIKETTSVKKAWQHVVEQLEQNIAVGLQLDSYHLEYFPFKFHFAGHFAAITGFDSHYAYMVDTKPNGTTVKTSLESLALARNEKGPMSAKNLMYTFQKKANNFDLTTSIFMAIKANANEYLTPPIKNISYKGILKTSHEIKNWYEKSNNIEHEFTTTAMLMEKAGTGGSLFRNLYRDFLKEAYEITHIPTIKEAHERFITIANKWHQVAKLLEQTTLTPNDESITQVSELLKELSHLEHNAMLKLQTL